MTIMYNPFDPDYVKNPYPQLKALREEEPVYRSPIGFWMLTRYDDINTALRDTERYSVDHRNASVMVVEEQDPNYIPVILFRDPPDHTRLRKLLAKAFTPPFVERFRPRMLALLDGLMDEVADKGEFDFVKEVAEPLPYLCISEMLGMPVEDRQTVLGWTSDIVNVTEPVQTPEVTQAIADSRNAMRDFLVDVVAHKKRQPADDLISGMIAAEADGAGLAPEELIDHIILLHVSAHEPTANHLAHGLLALLRHPDQLADLRSDPGLDTAAEEEMLRYEAPLQLTGRIALEDLEIDGHKVDKGTPVVMSLAAANHDPAHWGPDADELVLRRHRAGEHLSFARGIHTCFGATLARMQGQETFGRFVRRFPDVALAGEPEWNGRLNGRGPSSVPISVN
ncbi:cytochrome P450 [Catenulispora sp. MAP12-49]|uniref:cytochrome P450 n=1 Tax=Catenulispora sp. MAP12-49 TaxID=3156302 RepID=UPI0035171C28